LEKAVDSYETGEIEAAIVLLNAITFPAVSASNPQPIEHLQVSPPPTLHHPV